MSVWTALSEPHMQDIFLDRISIFPLPKYMHVPLDTYNMWCHYGMLTCGYYTGKKGIKVNLLLLTMCHEQMYYYFVLSALHKLDLWKFSKVQLAKSTTGLFWCKINWHCKYKEISIAAIIVGGFSELDNMWTLEGVTIIVECRRWPAHGLSYR